MTPKKGITILLAGEYRIIRQSLSAFLNQQKGLRVVGQTGIAGRAVSEALRLKPDLFLIDTDDLGFNWIEATARIRGCCPETRALALTMHREESSLFPFLEAGVCGYVHKAVDGKELIDAIQIAARQVSLRLDGVEEQIIIQRKKKELASGETATLSEREAQILCMVARGHTSQEIGKMFRLALSTVNTYRSRILKKINVTTRAELVNYAVENHLFY